MREIETVVFVMFLSLSFSLKGKIVIFMQIPVGARFIGIPATESAENPRGTMVEVYWEQDDSGALCISGHSPETPIPPHVQFNDSSTAPSSGIRILGRTGPVYGIVIDPNQTRNANS